MPSGMLVIIEHCSHAELVSASRYMSSIMKDL
jgi:hypothetical protein